MPAITTAIACPASSVDFSLTPRRGWLFYQGDTALSTGNGWNFRVCRPDAAKTVGVNMTIDTAQWYHVVGVYDGTNLNLYVNGALAASDVLGGAGANATYAPNTNTTIGTTFGARADGNSGNYGYGGNLDEAAYYSVALSAAQVQAHYQAGISSTPSTPYGQVVLADAPLGYWHLGESSYYVDPSTLPVATNNGSFGSVADGAYGPGVVDGLAGVPYTDSTPNNYAPHFNAIAGSISIPGQALVTNNLTITCWLKREGAQSLGALVFQRDGSLGVATGLQIWDSTGNTELRGNWDNADYDIGTGLTPPEGVWTFAAMVVTPTDTVIYMDNQSVSLAAKKGTALTHNAHDFSVGNLLIGQDIYAPPERIFNGLIDEVAVFAAALTPAQINQLLYSANVPPTILTQPPPAANYIAGSPVSVAPVVYGNPTLAYQWLKDGSPVSGQTDLALTFGNVTTNNSGNYSVVVTNAYGAITSSVVALLVTYPTAPAALANAVGYPAYNSATHAATLTQVILEFTGPLGAEASNPTHYAIPGLTVSGAQFTNLNQTVILTTTPQTQGAAYTVTVTGVTDGVGQPLGNNTASFRAWVASPLNGVRFEYYPSEATANPPFLYTDVGALINNSLFPDYPVLVTNLWAFDSRIIFPDDTHDSYGARMRGVFVPPSSGNWRFYLRSDDSSRLFLNPAGADPAGKVTILDATTCCLDWNGYQSAAFPLVAGQPYYLEMLYKEGGGGDYGKVAAKLDGTGYPTLYTANTAIDPAALAGPAIGYPYAPADAGGTLALAGPDSVTVQANHTAGFSVAVGNPAGWPISYQWRRNGSAITDATGSSYTLVPTTADNNARFTVQVFTLGSAVVSTEATLTVNPATSPPAVAAVRGSTALNTLIVSFNELLSAPATGSFSVSGFTTTSAVLDSTGTNVILTFFPPLTPGQTYTLSIQNVQDSAGNILASTTVPAQSFFFSRGLLKFDYFGGLSLTVDTIDQLTGDPRYPAKPDWTGFITGFDSRTIFPDDSHNGYGDHITGFFVPPTNGNYIFYIKSDDSSQFFFNPNGSDPAGSVFQMEETGCCHGFSANSNSVPLTLTNGLLYYMESNHKEGGGGDYVQVATQLDTDTTSADSLFPMAPALVGVLADPIGASVTITQQPANNVVVYVAGAPPVTVLNASFNANDGGFSATNYNSPVGPWSYNAGSGSWTNFGPAGCPSQGATASGLNTPAITLATNGSVVLTFSHRYSFEPSYDMGQVRLSVNGGPFATVPAGSFQQNGYIGVPAGTIEASVLASPGFIKVGFLNESPNYNLGSFITSVAYLGTYKGGDSIRIQFLANWDECSEGSEPNWEIDSVQVTLGGAPPLAASFSIGAESAYQNQPNRYMSYFWQVNPGSGFVDVPGTGTSPNLTQNIAFTDSGNQFRCIVYGPGASATSAVATVTVTLALTYTRLTANTLTLSWPLPPPPAPFSTFLLEQSPTMLPGSWTTVPSGTYQVTSTTVSASVTIQSGQNQFYRLRRN
jgi:hypothetical protein